jgi:hippurate hydrolase
MKDLLEFRRDLHRHPETGFEVHRTAERVRQALSAAGLEVVTGVGGSGVVATLRRGDNANAIGFRADMDALPITEASGVAYSSTNPGKFHGCGHDGHTAMLVGAALALAADNSLDRTVHFVFQPDEENGNGARAMVEDGLFERFPMTAIYGLHNLPGMEVGSFGISAGAFCAFEDNFEIIVEGRGGHASMPEVSADPIVAGAAVVLQLQTIVSRAVSAKDHAVVSVTNFETDGARNVLASNVRITGDCRGFSPEVSQRIESRMREIAEGVASAHGAKARVSYATSFQPLINDPAKTERAADAARLAGKVDAQYGRMGFSEDFAEFLEHRPGAFILMGNGTQGPHARPLHNPGYDFNDAAMEAGIEYWKALARIG